MAETGAAESSPTPAPDFSIVVSPDRMRILMECIVPSQGVSEIAQQIDEELTELGLKDPAKRREVLQAFERHITGTPAGAHLQNLLVLEGQAPTPPQDGHIDWESEFFQKGFAKDERTGNLDYRRQLARKSVAAGEHLATYVPPVPGKPGRDVFGKVVMPRKPKAALLRLGNNVEFDPDTNRYVTTSSGRIRFADDTLSVDSVFHVEGSIDLETGHISHPGAITVEENVESEAKVSAEGDLEVGGYIENASVYAGGDLVVKGGIAGGPKCVIQAQGDVRAKFAQNAIIEAGGDIIVEREISQCEVRALGAIRIPSGRVVGGNLIALRGLDAGQLGTDAGLRCNITVGRDFTLPPKITERTDKIEEHEKKLKKITEKLQPFRQYARDLSGKTKEVVTALAEEAKRLKAEVELLRDEIENMRREADAKANPIAVVRSEINPDAYFDIKPLSLLIQERTPGPVRIEILGGEIKAHPIRGLDNEGS